MVERPSRFISLVPFPVFLRGDAEGDQAMAARGAAEFARHDNGRVGAASVALKLTGWRRSVCHPQRAFVTWFRITKTFVNESTGNEKWICN
jgi:hypothetical protein